MNPSLPTSIVLVDDEKSYADLMAHMLRENLAWRVDAFTRPVDALSALSMLRPAVVVTDYNMPHLNGLEFIRLASAVVPHAAFLLITGHHLGEVEDEVARLPQLKGVLAKPFGWRTLADEILRVCPENLPSTGGRVDVASR